MRTAFDSSSLYSNPFNLPFHSNCQVLDFQGSLLVVLTLTKTPELRWLSGQENSGQTGKKLY